MDVTEIAFIRTVGVERDGDGRLTLPFVKSVENHLQSVHAGAQFALAEAASGDALAMFFPELVGRVVPLLRESKVKFKRPATSDLVGDASIAEASAAKFRQQIERTGRGLIDVEVTLANADGDVVSSAQFKWLAQTRA